MRSEIKLENKKKLKINTSWNWAYLYQEYFGHDIIPDLVPVIDTFIEIMAGLLNGDQVDDEGLGDRLYEFEVTTMLQIIWCLAKNADDDIPDIREWLDENELPFDIVIPAVLEALAKTMVSSKKARLLQDRLQEAGSRFIQLLSPQSTED